MATTSQVYLPLINSGVAVQNIPKKKSQNRYPYGFDWWHQGFCPVGNIPRLAAYERARRALRRECEPFRARNGQIKFA